jgi:DNA modification methylase
MELQLDHIEHADALTYLRTLPDGCVNCVVTSPPYFGLRDYGTAGQIGIEPTPGEYVAALVAVFREVWRVLRDDGVVWLNLGDSYAADRGGTHMPAQTVAGGKNGHSADDAAWRGQGGETRRAAHRDASLHGLPHKSLMGIPWRVAFGLQDDGWTLRSDIIWAKPNPMPESVTDRPTRSHEYIFLFAKQPKYWYDAQAVSEPVVRTWDATNGGNLSPKGEHKANGAYRERGGDYPLPRADGLRNRRTVWTITPANYADAHFATFPEAIPEICIKAGCPEGGVVLDPFSGAGTTALVAKKLNRRYLGCDLNADYVEMARRRVDGISYTLFSLMEVTGD